MGVFHHVNTLEKIITMNNQSSIFNISWIYFFDIGDIYLTFLGQTKNNDTFSIHAVEHLAMSPGRRTMVELFTMIIQDRDCRFLSTMYNQESLLAMSVVVKHDANVPRAPSRNAMYVKFGALCVPDASRSRMYLIYREGTLASFCYVIC